MYAPGRLIPGSQTGSLRRQGEGDAWRHQTAVIAGQHDVGRRLAASGRARVCLVSSRPQGSSPARGAKINLWIRCRSAAIRRHSRGIITESVRLPIESLGSVAWPMTGRERLLRGGTSGLSSSSASLPSAWVIDGGDRHTPGRLPEGERWIRLRPVADPRGRRNAGRHRRATDS
jgi:hypothetical protein